MIDPRCQKRRPLVFTTNKDLKMWGRVLHDNDLAEALLDRVLERGTHIKLTGRSYRTKDLDLTMTDGDASRADAAPRPESR